MIETQYIHCQQCGGQSPRHDSDICQDCRKRICIGCRASLHTIHDPILCTCCRVLRRERSASKGVYR